MKTIISAPGEVEVRTPAVLELVQFLVTGDLVNGTGTKWQYTDYVDTTTADEYVEVASFTIEPPLEGTLLQAIFELTANIKAKTSVTADITVKWEARNKGGTWVTLSEQLYEDIGLDYVNNPVKGIAAIVTNFNKVPFDVRMSIKCNELNEGRGRAAQAVPANFLWPKASDLYHSSVVQYLYQVV